MAWTSVLVVCVLLAAASPVVRGEIADVDAEDLPALVEENNVVAFFHAPWDGHSRRFLPILREAQRTYLAKEDAVVVRVNAEALWVREQYYISAYPTVRVFHRGEDSLGHTYDGPAAGRDFVWWLQAQLGAQFAHEWPVENAVVDVTGDTFEEHMLAHRVTLLEVYAEWCGFCQRFEPEYKTVARSFHEYLDISVVRLNGPENRELAKRLGVQQFPTLLLFTNHDMDGATTFPDDEDRTAKAVVQWVNREARVSAKVRAMPDLREEGDEARVVEVMTVEKLADMAAAVDVLVVDVYAPWCGHCQKLAPEYERVARWYDAAAARGDVEKSVAFVAVDGEQAPAVKELIGVEGYPTVVMVREADFAGALRYTSDKAAEALAVWLEKEEGIAVGPTPARAGIPSTSTALQEWHDADTTFDTRVRAGEWTVVEFYAPWCGYCQKLAPAVDALADSFRHSARVQVARVDATLQRDTAFRFDVTAYPHILLLHAETGEQHVYEAEEREAADLVAWVNAKTGESARTAPALPALVELTADNFDDIVLEPSKIAVVMFYQQKCPYCQRMQPTMELLARAFYHHPDVVVARLDADAYIDTARRFGGTHRFPTLELFLPGDDKFPILYPAAPRTLEALVMWVNDRAGTEQECDGSLRAGAGRVAVLDAWAEAFVLAEAGADGKGEREELQWKAARFVDGADAHEAWAAARYVKYMDKVAAKGAAWPCTEHTRLARLLVSASAGKRHSMTMRMHILEPFMAACRLEEGEVAVVAE